MQGKLRDFVKLPRNDISKSDKTGRIVGDTGLAGQLSPDWDEWLMGFPVGWTDVSATRVRPLDWSVDPANLPAAHPYYLERVVQVDYPTAKHASKRLAMHRFLCVRQWRSHCWSSGFFIHDQVIQSSI